jgi:hypothetical protein
MDFNTLKRAVVVLGAILLALITFYATLMIGGLVVGTIANTATSGSVPVSDAMNTSIASVEGEYITQSQGISANVPLITGLVAVILIVLIFFGKKFNLGGQGGSKGLN